MPWSRILNVANKSFNAIHKKIKFWRKFPNLQYSVPIRLDILLMDNNSVFRGVKFHLPAGICE